MKTVMIGLDGATFTVLDQMMAEGVMPRLAELTRRAARRTLHSTPLPITPQAWTTLATGRSMGHHGISDFVRLEFSPQGPVLRFNTSRDIHCEQLWLHASSHGKRVTLLNYIGTAPPPAIDGHVIPGFVPSRHLRRSTHPSDLFGKLAALEQVDTDLLGLDLDIEKQALQEMPEPLWLDWIDRHIARERAWFESLAHLMIHEPSDLTMIVFDGADKIQHLAYRFLDPEVMPSKPTPWEAKVIERCRAFFSDLDGYVARIVELAGEDAHVFVVSDHGFTSTREVVYINKWLHDLGLLRWRNELPEDDQASIVVHRLTRHMDQFDWERTRAFALTPSSNGVFIHNVPPEDYDTFREKLIAGLLSIKGPDGNPVVREVKRREDWFAGPYMKRAPDLTVTLRDFGFISVLNARDVVIPRKEPAGTHHPDGVFLAFGPGIAPGATGNALEMVDVAPLLVHSLGLPIPTAYEGKLPESVFEAEWLAAHPPSFSEESTSRVRADGDGEAMNEEDERVLLDRLRMLGYIE